MTSRRTELRAAFVDRLKDVTLAEERVHAGRLMPLEDEQPTLPAIIIHTREPEKILRRSPSGWNGFEKRRCMVAVQIVAQSFDDLDADLDAIANQVEAALQAWIIPGFESTNAFLVDSDMADPEFDGSLATSVLTLRYSVDYMTPYRACSDPYVDLDADDIMRSGAYPGGQVMPGCPADNTGEACPIGTAELFSDQEPIN
jgi:hypothetical protein